jgi:hypothetical protein
MACHAADGLSLAAAPAFALMAALTSGMPDMLCSITSLPLLSGMTPMYLLMSAVHLAPWLRVVARWRTRRPFAEREIGQGV